MGLHKARGKERCVSSIRFSGSYHTGSQESLQEKPINESAGQEEQAGNWVIKSWVLELALILSSWQSYRLLSPWELHFLVVFSPPVPLPQILVTSLSYVFLRPFWAGTFSWYSSENTSGHTERVQVGEENKEFNINQMPSDDFTEITFMSLSALSSEANVSRIYSVPLTPGTFLKKGSRTPASKSHLALPPSRELRFLKK